MKLMLACLFYSFIYLFSRHVSPSQKFVNKSNVLWRRAPYKMNSGPCITCYIRNTAHRPNTQASYTQLVGYNQINKTNCGWQRKLQSDTQYHVLVGARLIYRRNQGNNGWVQRHTQDMFAEKFIMFICWLASVWDLERTKSRACMGPNAPFGDV